PKGQAFAKWLVSTGASPTPGGTLYVESPGRNVKAVNPSIAQRWLYLPDDDGVRYFTFNTPVGAKPEAQCGRAVVTDLHLHENSLGAVPLPSKCGDKPPLPPQERAVECLLSDLSPCVQPDSEKPSPPMVK